MSLEDLASLLFRRRAAVLTGAGCSTESGIPDYRGPLTRTRLRRPVQYQDFLRSPAARARYWARSTAGWPAFRDAAPNHAHRALAALQSAGVVEALITQNVDRLHEKAGSAAIELHGALHQTRCLGEPAAGRAGCGAAEPRDALQERLLALNPAFAAGRGEIAPDGDVDLPDEALARFIVPPCSACGGMLKPDVVLFGESVPRDRVQRALDAVDAADVLLVVGSSLAVYSGYRFALRAQERGIPIAIVNLGETRADALAALRLEARAGDALAGLASLLG